MNTPVVNATQEESPAKKSVRIALNSESSVLGRRSEDEPIGMLASRTTSGAERARVLCLRV